MKNYLLISCLFVFTGAAFAQQSIPTILTRVKPRIVNFSELATYQQKHLVKKSNHKVVEQGEERDKDFKFKPKSVPKNAFAFNVNLPKGGNRSVSPSPDISFNGTLDNDYLTPPDINGVVGDSLIMETNNQEFDVFTKGGLLVSSVDLNTFYASVGSGFIFDPHLIYDAKHKKYIVVSDCLYNNGNGGLFIGVTQTSDPTGNWNLYAFDVMTSNAPGAFLDFPMIGFNKNWIVATANYFINDTAAVAQIDVFNKDSMYNNLPVIATQFLDSDMFSLSPAITDDSSLNTEYLVADWNGDSTNNYGYVRLATIKGTVTSPTYNDGQFIGINHPWSENVVDAGQAGSSATIATDDSRIDFAKYINGSLWFSHTVYLPAASPTYCAVDWWQVDPSLPTVKQFGRIQDSTGNTFYFYPCLNVNANNDALLGYTVSSYSSYASSGYVYRSSGDAPNTMENGYIYQPGLTTYYKTHGGGINRWGDFSGTAIDPSNNSFWTFQEYANTPVNNWGTVIANVTAPSCSNTPDAGAISVAKDTICNGSTAILQLYGNTIAENGIQLQWQQSENGVSGWSNVSSSVNTVASELISAPLNQTTYFRCQVTCINSNQTTNTAVVVVYVTGVSSVTNDSVCTPGKYNLIANGIGSKKWYLTDTSSTALSNTDTLSATIKKDTIFYVSVGDPTYSTVGVTDSTVGTGGIYSRFEEGLEFTALNDFIIDSVFVYPYSSGTIEVNLVDNATNVILQTDTFSIPQGAVKTKTKLPLNMWVEGGYDYKLNANGSIDTGLFRTSNASFPFVIPGVVSINRAINFQQGDYYFFYNWYISSTCNLTRTPVQVVIDTPMLAINAKSDSICRGDTLALSVSGAATYNWQPGNLQGNIVKVSPTTTTTYSVIGIDAAGCTAADSMVVYVNECTTSVRPVSNTVSIKAYPDPATNEINFIVNGALSATTYLEIDNVLGERLYLNSVDNKSINPITISSFATGIYFYKLISGNQPISEGKFIKQ